MNAEEIRMSRAPSANRTSSPPGGIAVYVTREGQSWKQTRLAHAPTLQPSATLHFFSPGNCTEAANFQARLKNALSEVSRMNKHTGRGQEGEHLITDCSDAACLLLAPAQRSDGGRGAQTASPRPDGGSGAGLSPLFLQGGRAGYSFRSESSCLGFNWFDVVLFAL